MASSTNQNRPPACRKPSIMTAAVVLRLLLLRHSQLWKSLLSAEPQHRSFEEDPRPRISPATSELIAPTSAGSTIAAQRPVPTTLLLEDCLRESLPTRSPTPVPVSRTRAGSCHKLPLSKN